ncbi:MAG: glycosyltransferase family 2 protein [bacterium]|nr:glycosyltransferase family 2 protein [bacterium]
MRKIKLLSIVVPCHNEESVISITNEKLISILNNLVSSNKISKYEIVYVDNGSYDNTPIILKQISKSYENIIIVTLRANYGYQGAISAGLYYANGDAVITIDADLQDPPEKIEEMVYFYEKGYDLVLGIREDRSSDSFLKRFFSENYYRLMKLLGVKIEYNHGDFRLMARPIVNLINQMPERNRLIRALVLQLESKYAKVFYKRNPRLLGNSKFNIPALLSLTWDGIVSFTYLPLRIASILGLLFFILGIIGSIWVLYIKIFTDVIPGWASTLLPLFLMGGFQLLFLGIIGEYIGRLYIEVKQRPLFVVRDVYKSNTSNEEQKYQK